MSSRGFAELRRLGAIAVPALVLGHAAHADMLHDHDNGPLTGFFGVPDSSEGAAVLDKGTSRWGAMLLAANHSALDERNGESITLDGETTRLELTYRRGIRPGLEIGVELPILWHETGGLDPLVDEWHDVLGMSGGFRKRRDYGQLEFLFTDAAGTQVDFGQNSNGLGDARLFAGWQLASGPLHNVALRFGVKLPTGDSRKLLGSGGTDISVGLAGDKKNVLHIERLSAGYRASAILIGEPDLLEDRHKDIVGHIALGLGYDVTERIELRLQGAFRSPLVEADVEPLGDPSITLTFGGKFRVGRRFQLSAAVTEDVKVRSAPDVAFQLTLNYEPR